jgi:hypothetical protein
VKEMKPLFFELLKKTQTRGSINHIKVMSKKTQNKETIYSILTETDLKKIKLTRNDGKDTTCYLSFTNDMKDDHKKGIYLTKVINSAGRKMGLEIYQTTHGGEGVHLILKPVDDRLEITVGCDSIDMLTTEIPIWYERSETKDLLIDLIKSMIKYSTDYIGNPTYIK